MSEEKLMAWSNLRVALFTDERLMAGIFIGIGCLAYLSIGGIIGAILFAFGLTSVVLTQSKLFTGMAGFWKSYKDILILIPVILLNFIGCFIVESCLFILFG